MSCGHVGVGGCGGSLPLAECQSDSDCYKEAPKNMMLSFSCLWRVYGNLYRTDLVSSGRTCKGWNNVARQVSGSADYMATHVPKLVQKLESNAQALTNCVFMHPDDMGTPSKEGFDISVVETTSTNLFSGLKDQHRTKIFRIRPSVCISRGYVGMSATQRKSLKAQIGTRVLVETCYKHRNFELSSIEVSIEGISGASKRTTNEKIMISSEAVRSDIHSLLDGRIIQTDSDYVQRIKEHPTCFPNGLILFYKISSVETTGDGEGVLRGIFAPATRIRFRIASVAALIIGMREEASSQTEQDHHYLAVEAAIEPIKDTASNLKRAANARLWAFNTSPTLLVAAAFGLAIGLGLGFLGARRGTVTPQAIQSGRSHATGMLFVGAGVAVGVGLGWYFPLGF